jgi:hypothetical protein
MKRERIKLKDHDPHRSSMVVFHTGAFVSFTSSNSFFFMMQIVIVSLFARFSHLEEVLLVGALAEEAVDGHVLLLPDAVAPRHRLKVVLGVPVTWK